MLKRTFWAFGAQIAAVILGLGFNVALARMEGTEGAGSFFLAFTIITVSATVSRLGVDRALVRFVAADLSEPDGPQSGAKVGNICRAALGLVLPVSLCFSGLLYLLSGEIAGRVFQQAALASSLAPMALAVVPLSLLVIFSRVLQGAGFPASAVFLQRGSPWLFALGFMLTPSTLLGPEIAYVLGVVASAFLAVFIWLYVRPQTPEPQPFSRGVMFRTSYPMMVTELLSLVTLSAPVLILGRWWSNSDVALFEVARRAAGLTGFILLAVNAVAAPRFSAFFARRELRRLENFARRITGALFAIAIPFTAVLILLASEIMGIFGPEFRPGAHVLAIISLGQCVNVCAGPVGNLLMMTGHERVFTKVIAWNSLAVLSLLLLVVPSQGLMAAAVLAGLGVATQNIAAGIAVRKCLGVSILPTRRAD